MPRTVLVTGAAGQLAQAIIQRFGHDDRVVALTRADGLGSHSGSDASHTTLGTSRVSVLNGFAGSTPMYSYLPAADTTSGRSTPCTSPRPTAFPGRWRC